MAATLEENRLAKCPVCTSNVEEQKLGMLGLTKEELSILKIHIFVENLLNFCFLCFSHNHSKFPEF